ncbi:MAG TPA: pteridine reductase [Xanthomonadaceae bacterium]|nr:pteridine reductase [Xanthomonadaceae bacterium]
MTGTCRTALVTGSARRIGAAIATHLHAQGYRLALHAHRSGDALAELAARLEAARPGSVLTLAGDLADPQVPARLVAQCIARFDGLDALVNNASNFYPTPVGDATAAQWDDLFAVNARAPFLLSQAAAPYLAARRGAIVNLTDVNARQPLHGHPIYSAAKSALDMLTRAFALELAPHVRVNAIAPGAILWPEAGKSEQARQALLQRTPLGRTGTPEEIAEAVRWLLEDASYVTGQTLALDGGRTLT